MTTPSTDNSSTATLLDGSIVKLRRLDAGDQDAIIALADTLTERERYLRFFTAHPAHLDEWARSLTDSSPGRFALGAFEDGTLLGIASYAESRQPGCAEVAVVVEHRQHDRGVGTALLRTLGQVARNNGQHHLVADVLAENYPMLKVLADAGWRGDRHLDGSVLTIEIDLRQIDDTRSTERRTV